MAEISPLRCPATKESPCCWHVVWKPSAFQAGQYDGCEQRCCWCCDTRPLTATYEPPKPHGPHMPNNPTSWLAPGPWR
jgi:hypothetical protein